MIESSDEMEIDVSQSNSMFLFSSLRILFGLPFPFRLGDFRFLVVAVWIFLVGAFDVVGFVL